MKNILSSKLFAIIATAIITGTVSVTSCYVINKEKSKTIDTSENIVMEESKYLKEIEELKATINEKEQTIKELQDKQTELEEQIANNKQVQNTNTYTAPTKVETKKETKIENTTSNNVANTVEKKQEVKTKTLTIKVQSYQQKGDLRINLDNEDIYTGVITESTKDINLKVSGTGKKNLKIYINEGRVGNQEIDFDSDDSTIIVKQYE